MASLNIDAETGIVSDMSLMQAMCHVSDCRFTMRMHSASPVNGGRRLGGRTDQGLLQPCAVVLSTAGRGPSCVGFIIAFCCAESLRHTGRG